MNVKEQGIYCLSNVHLLDKCRCTRSCFYTALLEGEVSFFTAALEQALWDYLCQNEMCSYSLRKIGAVFDVSAQAIKHRWCSRPALLG